MDAKKITYVFEKRAHIKDTLNLVIRTDIPELKGFVTVFNNPDSIHTFSSSHKGEVLTAAIPVKKLPSILRYGVTLQYKDSLFTVPAGTPVITTFCYPKIPTSILSVYYFCLFVGLLLAVRIGLEFFTDGRMVKKYAIFTLILFSLHGFFIVPVINFIEANAINKTVLQPEQMFNVPSLGLSALWIAAVVVFFSKAHKPYFRLVFAAATIVLFFFNNPW